MDKQLQRQLRRARLSREALPDNLAAWQGFVDRVARSYAEHQQDRYLLERSLDISSREMQTLYDDLRAASESRVAAERDKLKAIINGFRDGFCTLDRDGRLESANPAALKLLGIEEPPLGQPMLHRFIPSSGEALTETEVRVVLGQVFSGLEQRDRRSTLAAYDGKRIPVSVLLYPIVHQGEVSGCALIFSDITALLRTEASRKRLAQAVAASADAIYITDIDGVIEYVNPAFTRITGLASHEAIGKRPGVLSSGRTPTAVYRSLWSTITAGEVWSGRLLNRRRDADARVETYWAETTIAPLMRDRSSEVIGFVAVQRDVSTEVEREQERERETRAAVLRARIAEILQSAAPLTERLREVVAAVAGFDGLRLDGDALIVCRSPTDQPVVVLRAGDPSPDLEPALVEADEDLTEPIYLPALGGLLLPIVQSGQTRGGVWLGGTAEPALSHAQIALLSLVAGMIGVAIADQEARDQLDRARTAAMDAVEAKSRFLANMSHEIRTPMNGVLGMLEMLSQTELDREQQDFVETAMGSAEGLLTVINDVLDFSKIEAGKLDLEYVPFDLRPLAEDVMTLLSARAHSDHLELACYIPLDLPTRVVGDPTRLRQVLNNLVGNAVKFTERGEVVLRVLLQDGPRLNRIRLRFEVQDTGIGMTPEQAARLFLPFVQADSGTTRRFGGTGLGLAISKQLVELMGGEIGVDSVYGEGSTFWFAIPFDSQGQAAQVATEHNLTGLRVLSVDDNATNRTIISHYLQSWGVAADTAVDGFEALELLRAAAGRDEPYAIAVLDMQMPGIDGLALARLIKSEPPIAPTRLIMVSSMGQNDLEVRAEGIQYLLSKPIRQSHLYDALLGLIETRRTAPSVAAKPPSRVPAAAEEPLRGNILLAEDNPVNQRVAAVMLKRLGLSCDLAEDGIEAVRKATATAYDVILMDCQMPNMDGFEATHRLRAQEPASGRPVIIALTANAMVGDRERCIASGMDDYIPKPLKREALRECLQRWLPAPEEDDLVAAEALDNTAAQARPDAAAMVLDPDVMATLQDLLGDGYGHFLDLFDSKTVELIGAIEDALERGDAAALRLAAHSLKGSTANVGAAEVQALAEILERKGRAGHLDGAALILARLRLVQQRMQADVRRLRNNAGLRAPDS